MSNLRQKGFTALELLAVLVVITILATFAMPNMKQYIRRAGEVRCMGNMRGIIVGLRGYMLDHDNVWPQGPTPDEEAPWENFWLNTLQPYGVDSKTWQCPTITSESGPDAPRVQYTPTLFPDTPGIAERWNTHPWLIERGDTHGSGALIAFPDGSIKSFDKVLAELGTR